MRPLGSTQKDLLRALQRHQTWYNGCDWIWGSASSTARVLESLVKRGLVETQEQQFHPNHTPTLIYRVSQAGQAHLSEQARPCP